MCVSHKEKAESRELSVFSFWAYLSDFLKLSSHLLTQSPTKRAITAEIKEIMYFMCVSPPFSGESPTSIIIIQLSFNVNF